MNTTADDCIVDVNWPVTYGHWIPTGSDFDAKTRISEYMISYGRDRLIATCGAGSRGIAGRSSVLCGPPPCRRRPSVWDAPEGANSIGRRRAIAPSRRHSKCRARRSDGRLHDDVDRRHG